MVTVRHQVEESRVMTSARHKFENGALPIVQRVAQSIELHGSTSRSA